MNCNEFWNQIPVDGADITAEQTKHLEGCAECVSRSLAHRTLRAGLKSLAEESRQMQAPPRVETGLTAAFRAQNGWGPARKKVSVLRVARPSWVGPVVAWAAAAALMIVLGAALVRGWHPEAQSGDSGANPARNVHRVIPQIAAVQASEEDEGMAALGEGFVRLPNAARIGVNELMDVVRVEVPASAIIAMGLTVSEEQSAETLVADVALGQDGMARAVRLVDGGSF